MGQHEHSVDVGGKVIPAVVDIAAAGEPDPMVGLVLAHGASGDMDSGYLPHLAAALAARGIPVVRFTHKSSKVSARAAVYEAVLRDAASKWPETRHIRSWVCAGHSMGSRAACEVIAKLCGSGGSESSGQIEDSVHVVGCVLLSFPLHPPDKPGDVREAWLRMVYVPGLMVRGTRDHMSSQPVYEEVMSRVGKQYLQVYEMARAGHDLVGKKGPDSPEFQALTQAVEDFVRKVGEGARAEGAANLPAQTSGRSTAEPKGTSTASPAPKVAGSRAAEPKSKGRSKSKAKRPAAPKQPKQQAAATSLPAATKPRTKRKPQKSTATQEEAAAAPSSKIARRGSSKARSS